MTEPHTGRQPPARAARVLAMARRAACLLIIASGAAWIGVQARALAIDLPTQHLDGAFQTASGLYRLKDGQWPGRDFFPYLGVGPLLALLPLFLAAGAHLAASVMAAQVLTQAAGVFAVALLWQLVFRPQRLLASAAGGMLLFVGLQVLPQLAGPALAWLRPPGFEFGLTPGNSLRPLRALLPYLVAGGFCAVHALCGPRRERLRCAGWGVLTGACVLWSNDYAFTTGALACVAAVVAAWRGEGPRAARAATFAAAALVTAPVVLLLATRGRALELLRYNLVDVAGDQWWMFMPYVAEARVFGWADLGRLLNGDTAWPLRVLAVVLAWALLRRSARAGLLAFIGAGLFAGGAVASVGGHLGDYFGAFRFWAGMLALVAGLRAAACCVAYTIRWRRQWLPAVATATLALGGTSVAAALLAVQASQNLQSAERLAARDPGRFFVPELGGYLGQAWRPAVQAAREQPAAVLVEEYWGLWSALRGGRSGWPVDAVIHALGDARKQAAAALARADIITSTRLSLSPEWQPWSLSQNHWFHRELLDHWVPAHLTPTTIVWQRRRGAPPAAEPVACEVDDDEEQPRALLRGVNPGLHELTLHYRLGGRGRSLLLVHNQLSPGTQGWASIDPRAASAQLPVEVSDAGDWVVPLQVLGRPAAALDLLGCRARRLPAPPPEVWRAPSDTDDPFYLSDVNWDRGIARHWAGFFLPNTPQQRARFVPGARVRFRSGEQRRILRTELQGAYLHVHVDGQPWAAETSGLPRAFTVTPPPVDMALR